MKRTIPTDEQIEAYMKGVRERAQMSDEQLEEEYQRVRREIKKRRKMVKRDK